MIEDFVDTDTLASLVREIDQFEEKVERQMRNLSGGKAFIGRADEITFSSHLVRHSKLLRNYVSRPAFLDLCLDILGPDVRLYWDHAVYKKPGVEKPFPWHQDNGYTFLSPQQYLTTWTALTDADENNGCLYSVPGMHKLGTLEHTLTDLGNICFEKPPVTPVPIPVKAGSLVIMSAITPHQTGANFTQQVRKGYVVQYAHEGAKAHTVDAHGNPVEKPACQEDRQFAILKNGQAV
ncbi:MAG: phytanoyl-CoA dioxygenase family protein [Limnobacter sp.]|nr:phytanoyl-CoA dioxygenase family protein [Limnobacter sp.]